MPFKEMDSVPHCSAGRPNRSLSLSTGNLQTLALFFLICPRAIKWLQTRLDDKRARAHETKSVHVIFCTISRKTRCAERSLRDTSTDYGERRTRELCR